MYSFFRILDHEGVMIQCETCKVWQHCPCVGLGDGEVTPDYYYCESCRPENHPYRVVNGQLISNSKSSSSLKPTKKRSTMNSKEASIPMDLMLAQQKWNEEHQDELEDDFIQRTTSKRRKKTSSSTTDLDDDTTHHNQDTSNKESTSSALTAFSSSSDKKKEKTGSSSNDQESPSVSTSSSPSSSPKTGSNHGRMGPKKSSANKSASKARSRSNSPMANGVENRSNNNTSIEDEAKRTASVEDRSPSTKRRKISSRSEVVPHSEPASPDADEAIGKNDANESDMHTRSRKSGGSSRSNNKRNNTNSNGDNEYSHEDSIAPNISSQSVSSPPTTNKKTLSKRYSDRGHNARTGSRHSTPGPATEGTPQPMAPAPPATVRYPSSKMTIHEMTKRAKQLLDYISRVQIDMADRKNKIETQSPSAETAGDPAPAINHDRKHIHHPQKDVAMNDESVVFRLPAPASSIMHGDSQVCPDLSRSSMESTASSMDGVHEPSSPVDTKVPTNETASSKEMTIKVVPMNPHDTLPLLSTPPLSVHDRHHHHQHHQRLPSGTPESESTHEPLTPPHQPTESDEQQQPNGEDMTSSSSSASSVSAKANPSVVTSLDLMDKLTGDLIRFQERFGAYA
ncbi:hypothetical protein BGZ80_007448 [Entomortierella chlamydospora]|uniref:Zinc finger PHD-type domain-containing protein n=1 Tax=Entomortierella chlamydospora TaxID=101097 RepID=A0A9P6T1L8_9FUNG|nr:hypothetical protein BGZ80_007448 [Entomortierella chlamydospora]